jgi:hypothetical protein
MIEAADRDKRRPGRRTRWSASAERLAHAEARDVTEWRQVEAVRRLADFARHNRAAVLTDQKLKARAATQAFDVDVAVARANGIRKRWRGRCRRPDFVAVVATAAQLALLEILLRRDALVELEPRLSQSSPASTRYERAHVAVMNRS